jgi:hypothetical protein
MTCLRRRFLKADIDVMITDKIYTELEMSEKDIREGRVKPAQEVIQEIRARHEEKSK